MILIIHYFMVRKRGFNTFSPGKGGSGPPLMEGGRKNGRRLASLEGGTFLTPSEEGGAYPFWYQKKGNQFRRCQLLYERREGDPFSRKESSLPCSLESVKER